MLNENTGTGAARRAKFGGIKQRVSSSEVVSNTQRQNQIADHAARKKAAGDAAHAAATEAGKSPMEAETARNRAHRQYEKAQKKLREDHTAIAMGKMLDSEGAMINNQLETIERSVALLRAQIKSDDMQVPAWVQAKVTLATENILTCANYMAGKDENVKEEVKSFADFIKEGAAWQRKEGKNKNGGLNEKGRQSYEEENPGSDLKAPSKVVGNPRRTSFCARMKGMKSKLTSKKTARDPNSRINKSLRAWNC
jgi:hypothetical protein